MPSLRFTGEVKKGQFVPDDAVRWSAALGKLAGRRVLVDVHREVKSHSSNQRRYYFAAVVATVAAWSGHTKEETHYFLKKKFLPSPEIVLPTGEVVEGEPSTKKLSSEEMSEYITRCIAWAGECELPIPGPNEIVY